MEKKWISACLGMVGLFSSVSAQIGGTVSGAIQSDVQYYMADDALGIPEEDVPEEKILTNNYFDLNYRNGNFSAGMTVEAYMNSLLNTLTGYEGVDVKYRYLRFNNNDYDVTVGSFYEQFGSGMIFRTYLNRDLGIDNSINGLRVGFTPNDYVRVKGIIGNQRQFMDYGDELIRGLDAEVDLTSDYISFFTPKMSLTFGLGMINRFQKNPGDDPLPQNVGAISPRATLRLGKFALSGEYSVKSTDPNTSQPAANQNYDQGRATIINTSYSKKGMGVSFTAKRVYNMDFRSRRDGQLTEFMLNFVPTSTKQHLYTLTNVNPYNTQPRGELSYQFDFNYLFKRKTALGGKYGTRVSVNAAIVNGLETGEFNTFTKGFDNAKMFGKGTKFFRDYNFEIHKKFTKRWKGKTLMAYQTVNWDLVESGFIPDKPYYGEINSIINMVEFTYKPKRRHSVIFQLQHMISTNEGVDKALKKKEEEYFTQFTGNWVAAMIEYNIAPQWGLALIDQYNYGNPWDGKKVHYPIVSVSRLKGASRFELRYGKVRKGLLCVGGICRPVDASHSFTMSFINSF